MLCIPCIIDGILPDDPKEESAEFLGLAYEHLDYDRYEDSCRAVVRINGSLVIKLVQPSRIRFPHTFRL